MVPQILALLVVDPTEPQDRDPVPPLLIVTHFEIISTHTVMSEEAIEHHRVESTANVRFLPESEAEIRPVPSHLLVVAEDMLLEIALQLGEETTTLNRSISSQTWLA